MKSMTASLFAEAGIALDGKRPFDLRVRNQGFHDRFLAEGTLGLGESYMDGWWECDALDEMMARFSRASLSKKFASHPRFLVNKLRAGIANQGNRANADRGVRSHYDLGDDLYRAMLDERMIYTCGYWKNATTLAEAQEHKMDLVARKLGFAPGMSVLDIGCGWGGFAEYVSRKYGVSVVGVTNSRAQAKAARERCRGLAVEIRLEDYRETRGRFDRVVSMGMFEHVCYKNHRAYMELVHRCLADDGLSLLHTMGRKKSLVRGNDQWITKYIFPNTQVPSVEQVGAAIDDLFVMEDWENLSVNYERTLLAWQRNFEANWPSLEGKYDERFRRMWNYYLLIFAGWYRSRALQLWHVVLSKHGVPGGYVRP